MAIRQAPTFGRRASLSILHSLIWQSLLNIVGQLRDLAGIDRLSVSTDSDGNIAVTGGVRLGTGKHSIRLEEGREPLFLLPADITVPFDLTRPRERKTLFDRVYTF